MTTSGEADPPVSAAAPERAGAAARPRISPERATAIAYVVAVFLGAMDSHIVNVALPTLSRAFHSPLASVQWTVIGYVLSLAVWIPASGWIGDRIGTKRTFVFAIAMFSAASALCGQADSLVELVVFRVLQGAGGGLLLPMGTAMLYRAYPPERRARMARILIMPILLGPAIAPVVGGLLIEDLSWRWAFYLNLPFGAAALFVSARYLVEHKEAPKAPFDLYGFALSASGLSLALFAVSEGPLRGWSSTPVVVAGVVGVLALVGFVQVEKRRREPLLRLGLLEDRLFRAMNTVSALSTASFLGTLYLAPIFLQEARGLSPLSSGLTTFVEALGVVVSSQTVGRLYHRLGPRRLCAFGFCGVTTTIALLATLGPGTNLWWIRLVMFVMGFTNSAAFLSVQSAMFATIPASDSGHGSAISAMQRQVALACGVALLSSVVAGVHGTRIEAFHWGFSAAAMLAALGIVASLVLVHDEDAAATMVRPVARAAGEGLALAD